VNFPAHNQLLSWWLPICVPKTQNDKAYWIPDIGEQVVCLMDEHDEDGAVIGCIYSQADTTPVQSADKWHITMKDNAVFEYDRNAHTLNITLPTIAGAGAGGPPPSGSMVTISCNNATIQIDASGNINLTAQGNINLVTSEHNDSVNGIIDTFNAHTHSDPSEGNTGVPNQRMT
jgi:phage baseplate assembly protein V